NALIKAKHLHIEFLVASISVVFHRFECSGDYIPADRFVVLFVSKSLGTYHICIYTDEDSFSLLKFHMWNKAANKSLFSRLDFHIKISLEANSGISSLSNRHHNPDFSDGVFSG